MMKIFHNVSLWGMDMTNVTAPRSRPRRLWIIIAVVLAAGAALAFAYWRFQGNSYEGPIATSDPIPEMSRPSVITIPITASLDDLQARLNNEFPARLYTVDENRDACIPAQMAEICLVPRPFSSGCAVPMTKFNSSPQVDCHVDGFVDRGPISVGGSGDTLDVGLPISAEVTVRGRGDLDRGIQETATGKVDARATMRADVNENWEPTAEVNADYSWSDRIGVDVMGFRITFASKVDPEIRKLIESFKEKVPGLLAELKLKEKANEAWSKGFGTFLLSKSPDVWLRFSPSAVGFEGFKIDGRVLRTAVMAGGTTETFVGNKPNDPPIQPLPSLQRTLPDPAFSLFLPVSADYGALAEAAEKGLKLGEPQTLDVPKVGPVKVIFRDVDIHQTSDGKLAIGISMEADSPQSFLDTKGSVWVVTNVDVDNENKRVKVGGLDIYSRTDNAPFDLLVSIISLDAVNREIRKAVEYDFSKDYQVAIDQANVALNRQASDDLFLSGKVDGINVEKIAAGPQSLIAYISAAGSVAMQFGKLPQ